MMKLLPPFLGAIFAAPTRTLRETLGDPALTYHLLFGGLAAVIALVVIWVMFFRKRAQGLVRYRSPHDSRRGAFNPGIRQVAGADPAAGRGRRWRRRGHRPRNPTLAETGGLPPLRGTPPSELGR